MDVARESGKGPRDRIFEATSFSALQALKRRCATLGFHACGWHAFRRGGAEDMVSDGHELGYVLHAGGWRSASFLRYISRENLDTQAAFESVMGLSDGEER